MKTFALAAAALGLAAVATPSFAGTETVRSVEVSFAGLNLDSPEGQKTLDERIDRAARAVCGRDEAPTGTRIVPKAASECFAKARANAKNQVAVVMADRQRGG